MGGKKITTKLVIWTALLWLGECETNELGSSTMGPTPTTTPMGKIGATSQMTTEIHRAITTAITVTTATPQVTTTNSQATKTRAMPLVTTTTTATTATPQVTTTNSLETALEHIMVTTTPQATTTRAMSHDQVTSTTTTATPQVPTTTTTPQVTTTNSPVTTVGHIMVTTTPQATTTRAMSHDQVTSTTTTATPQVPTTTTTATPQVPTTNSPVTTVEHIMVTTTTPQATTTRVMSHDKITLTTTTATPQVPTTNSLATTVGHMVTTTSQAGTTPPPKTTTTASLPTITTTIQVIADTMVPTTSATVTEILTSHNQTICDNDLSMNITSIDISSNQISFNLNGSTGQHECWITSGWGRVNETSPEVTRVFSGLQPNTNYTIKCMGVENNCSVWSIQITTTKAGTTPGTPNITMNMTTCTNITLHWIPPNNNGEEIQEYNITYYTGGELVNSVAVPGDNTSATVQNLKPNTMYTIQVRARNSEGAGDADNITISTPKRGNATLIINSTTGSSLELFHFPTGVQYTCTHSQNGNFTSFNITEQGYNLTGLRPDTTYTIDCVAYLNGVDYCLEVNTSARTAPDEVDNLTVVGLGTVDGDWIHQSISWRRPPHHTSQLNYTIRYGLSTNMGLSTNISTSNTTVLVIIELPKPTKQTVYNVWVAAVSDVGQGEYRMINITYREPSPPENIAVINETCNSLSVQWSPPSDTGGLEITGYRVDVTGNNVSISVNTTMTSYGTLSQSELHSNSTYEIRVKAITTLESAVKKSNITTGSRKQFQMQLHPFSSTGLNLTIIPPHNNDGVNYTCTLSPGNGTLSGNVTVTDLSPNTTYSVRCLVYENGEDLCYEGIGNGRTFPKIPEEEPSNVTVTKTESNQFTVKWGPLWGYEYNQDIRGYNVKYWRATGSEDNATTNNVTTTTYTATGLDTNTVYTFRVAAYTEEGIGVYSESVNISTIPRVENITPSPVSTTTAVIQWKGVPNIYSIWLTVTVDEDFGYGRREFNTSNVTGKTSFTIRRLDPYRSYTIEMYLQLGERGNGSRESVSFRTLGSAPTKAPRLLTVQTDKRKATLQWMIPIVSGRNGIITDYEIHWRSANTQTSPIIHNVSQPNFTHPEQISRTIQGLAPYTTYTWRVAAVNVNGTGPFSAWDNFTTEESMPGVVQNLIFTMKTQFAITVEWEPPSTPNGVITHYKVCTWVLDGDKCSKKSSTTETEETIKGLDPGVPYRVSVTAYTSAGPGPENTLYEIIFTKELKPEQTVTNITIKWINATAVNISWIPLGIHQARGFPSYTVIISSEGTPFKSRNTNDSSVVIGELNNNRLYTVTVQSLTGGGKGRQSDPVTFGVAEEEFSYWIIAIILVAILLVVVCFFCVILTVVCVRNQQSKGVYYFNEEAICLQDIVTAVKGDSIIALQNMQRKDPIPKHLFSDHVRNMHNNKDRDFKAEFASLTREPPVSKGHAEANGSRNRYINIYAYDYCRVVLNDDDGSDYINAAFIDGYKKPNFYIAAQGPTSNTIMDFWEMVWEQKSTIIVMLTRLVEGGKTKCEQYWSEEHNAPYQPGRDLIVTTTSHKVMPGFEIREFSLEKASVNRNPLLVKHFLYTAWPDHGVPQYSSSMVKFILQQIKPEMQKTTSPIVVHCSAGAGRTGTFIAIDTTLDRLEEEDNINIFECVEMMRTKRTQMVQTAVQYIYIHDAINDHIACGETAIVANDLGQMIAELSKSDLGVQNTVLEEQYYLLEGTCLEMGRADRDFGDDPEVKAKNRYPHLHPYSDNYIQTDEDELYVNATHIPGYYGQSGFIAAQTPMKNTIEDTWNVIREQNCSVVVVLCKFMEQEQEMCEPFWPTEVGVTMTIGPMKISLMNTVQSEHYDVYELTSTAEGASHVSKTEIHHYKSWNKYGRPDVSSLLKLMGDVQRTQQGHTGPVMVMCDDGMSRTGVFITVMSEIDRVKVEGEMDIFHTVKAARTFRPNMVSTVHDYELCHEIGLNYLESFDSYANLKA